MNLPINVLSYIIFILNSNKLKEDSIIYVMDNKYNKKYRWEDIKNNINFFIDKNIKDINYDIVGYGYWWIRLIINKNSIICEFNKYPYNEVKFSEPTVK